MYVGDRENHSVQVFESDGTYLTQWAGALQSSVEKREEDRRIDESNPISLILEYRFQVRSIRFLRWYSGLRCVVRLPPMKTFMRTSTGVSQKASKKNTVGLDKDGNIG